MRTFLLTAVMTLIAFGFLTAHEENKESENKETPKLTYQVVVTATRTPQNSRELGSSLSIIPGGQFGAAASPEVLSRLALVPGLNIMQNGGLGQSAGISIRGANSEHTLVLIDGIEVNDPSSPSRSFDFGTLDMNAVERIEVVRGAQSPLYGSDAMGGVIQIISKRAKGKDLSFSLGAEGGRYATFRERLSVTGRNERAAFSLGFSRTDSEGFSAAAASYGNLEKDGLAQNQFHFIGDIDFGDALKLGVTSRYSQADIDLDNGGGMVADDPNNQADNRHLILALRGEWTGFSGQWRQLLHLSHQNIDRKYENPADELNPSDSSTSAYRSLSHKINWQHELSISERNQMVAGFEWQREQAESNAYYSSIWGEDVSVFPLSSASTVSAYTTMNLDFGNKLFINSGLRYDHHSQFGGQLSLKISPAFFVTKSTKLMASLSNGFKAPSLYQLFAPATMWGAIGNPKLDPETAVTLDLGVQQSLWDYRVLLELSFFHNRYRNLIDYDWTAGYINIASARSRGLELSVLVRPDTRTQFSGSYTYTDAVDEENDLPLLRRPRHRYNLAVSWQPINSLAFSADLRHTGTRPDLFPYPERMTSKAYTLISAGIEWTVKRFLTLYGRIENLGNLEYEPVIGYGAAGRSATIGAQLEL